MEIVLVHGFRGDAEGLLEVGVELGRILSGEERGGVGKVGDGSDGWNRDSAGVIRESSNNRDEVEVEKVQEGSNDGVRVDVKGSREVKGSTEKGLDKGNKRRSGENVKNNEDDYSSGDIIVGNLEGKYTGKIVKYAGGDIFLPDLPPFGGAGGMEGYVKGGDGSGGADGADGAESIYSAKNAKGTKNNENVRSVESAEEVNKYFNNKRNNNGGESSGMGKEINDKEDEVNKKVNDKRNRVNKDFNHEWNEGDLYSPEGYAEFLRGFIEEYGLKEPVLVGHSMGSLVVAATAERYPEMVNKKVVLLAPVSKKTNKFFTQLQPLVTLLPNKMVGWMTTRFLWIPRGERKKYREALRLTYAGGAKYTSKEAVRAAARFSTGYAVGDFNLEEKEVLLLAGETDRLIPRWQTEELARGRGWRVELVRGVGHLLNYERAGEVAREVAEFLM